MTGKEFQRRRKGMKLTQKQIGELLDYDEMTISRFERNEREIPRSVALALDSIGIQHFLKLEQSWCRKRLLECGHNEREVQEIIRSQGWV